MAAAAATAGSTWYVALSLGTAHAAWASSVVPKRSMSMTTFFYTLLPNEFAPLAALVHAGAVVFGVRRLAAGAGSRTATAALVVGVAINAAVMVFHVGAALRNAAERHDVVDVLNESQIPHSINPKVSYADWVRLSLLFPGYFFSGKDVAMHRNVAYVDGPDAHWKHRLDVFVRKDQAQRAPAPVFFYVHGGGWIFSDKVFVPYTLFATLLRRGWIVVCCNYRLAPRVAMPEIVHDVKRALVWTKTVGCARFGGDPRAVACGGESAGGHLALTLAMTAHDCSYQLGFEDADTSVLACLDLYGVHDLLDSERHFAARDFGAYVKFMGSQVMQAPRDGNEELWRRYSPRALLETVPMDTLPPIMGVHGSFDNLVPVNDARAFYTQLRRQRPAHAAVYLEFASAHHCFNWIPSPRTLAFDEAAAAFLAHAHAHAKAHRA